MAFSMPEYSSLSDQEIAEILTFVRANWGNQRRSCVGRQRQGIARGARAEIDALRPISQRRDLPICSADPAAASSSEGMRLMTETPELLPHTSAIKMSCSSCHLNGGTVAHSSPYVGITPLFPSYNPRAGRVITMQDRLNGCFRRSMSGAPLDDNSPEMRAMIAFMEWMKDGSRPDGKIRGPRHVEDRRGPGAGPDPRQDLYRNQCAVCHGTNGEGRKTAERRLAHSAAYGATTPSISAPAWREPTRPPDSSKPTCRSRNPQVSAGSRRAFGPGCARYCRLFHPPTAFGFSRQGEGLAEGRASQGFAILTAPDGVRAQPASRGRHRCGDTRRCN